jgi:ferredoxin--NADP+ reductase
VISNEGGRVTDEAGETVPGQYVAGWIKRGPSGVIGTNKKDANQTVEALFQDLEAERLPEPGSPEPAAVEELLSERAADFVTYAGWGAIDRAEVERGKPQGRPRVKFVRVEEMLEAAAEESTAASSA